MENPNEDQSFKSSLGDVRSWLKPPYIETKFVEVTSALTWVNIDESKGWKRILPIPGIDPSETEFDPFYRRNFTSLTGPPESIKSLTEKRSQRWADRSERWLLESRLTIARYKDLLRRLCQTGIDEWKAKGKTTTITADGLITTWTKRNRNKTVAWVESQLFTQERKESIIEKEIGLFVSEILQDRMESYGLSKPKLEKPHYKSFDKLFINTLDIEPCIQALRSYRPEKPVLGEGLTWTGSIKDKGLIVAWIERLETIEPKKIVRLSNRKQLVELLNAYFENLEMGKDASVFNKVVDPTLQDAFKSLLPE